MKTLLKLTWVTLVAVLVVLGVTWMIAPHVMAQGPQPWGGMRRGMNGGPHWGMTDTMPMGNRVGVPQTSLVTVAAKTLNMNEADLLAALNGGKTIAEVAKEKNVELITIIDAFVAPRIEQMSKFMSKAQVDAMAGTMKAHLALRLNEKFAPANRHTFMDANHDGICDTCGAGQGNMPMRPMGGRGVWGR